MLLVFPPPARRSPSRPAPSPRDVWFLPQVGAIWDATDSEQVFANVQENVRQFVPYAAGSNFYGSSPWSLGSQLAFDTFKQTAHPERSWTLKPACAPAGRWIWARSPGSMAKINWPPCGFLQPAVQCRDFQLHQPKPRDSGQCRRGDGRRCGLRRHLAFRQNTSSSMTRSPGTSRTITTITPLLPAASPHRGPDRRQAGAARAQLAEPFHHLRQLGRV